MASTPRITTIAYTTTANQMICMPIQDAYQNDVEPLCGNKMFADVLSFYTDRITRNDASAPFVSYYPTTQYQTIFQCRARCASDKADLKHTCFPSAVVRPGITCPAEFWMGSRTFLCNNLVEEAYPYSIDV